MSDEIIIYKVINEDLNISEEYQVKKTELLKNKRNDEFIEFY